MVIAVLSTLMITSMVATSLFDQKADAVKSKPKKFTKGGNGGNGGTGGNGGSGNTCVSGGGSPGGPPDDGTGV